MLNPRFSDLFVKMWENPKPPEEKLKQKTKKPSTRLELPSSTYSFLEKELAKEVHSYIISNYQIPNIKNITYDENEPVKGSNPSYVIAVNDYFRKNNLKIRTVTQADLEKIIKKNALNLMGYYEDSALVLRDDNRLNSYLAKDLLKQIGKTELPVMIILNSLELRTDSNSPYKLAFNLTDQSELIYAPILNQDSGYFDSENINEKTGLPKKLGEGKRYFYTRKTGLSRLCLGGSLNLDSGNTNFAYSNFYGRVVLVSPEMTQKI